MEVIVAEKGGFCFGVKRAVKMAFDAAAAHPGNVHSLGPLIHNPQVVERMAEVGVKTVSSLSDIEEGGAVIFRSHGVASPQLMTDAKEAGLKVIDATCPFVTNAQRYARQLVDEGYQVVMVGNPNHPEAQSVIGHAGGDILVTESFAEIKQLLNRFPKKRLGLLSQTTQTFARFSEIVVWALQICEEVKVFNTICYATEENQAEVQQLAGQVDAMVIVGGKNSANTGHLAELCRKIGVPTYHIETASGIDAAWFHQTAKVGVAAGASTPDWIIDKVVAALRNIPSAAGAGGE
jgi:4-hydroxy-3-methylbut-2-enyl diphosphate reductase